MQQMQRNYDQQTRELQKKDDRLATARIDLEKLREELKQSNKDRDQATQLKNDLSSQLAQIGNHLDSFHLRYFDRAGPCSFKLGPNYNEPQLWLRH